MRRDRGDNPGGERRVSREEIDRLFDRELSPETRRELVGRLRQDRESLDEVIETRRLVEMLRAPVEAPDLTGRVLAGVQHRRGFLSSRLRKRVRQGRAAVAASVLLGLFSVAVAHRLNPGLFRLHATATPVADLGEAVRQDSIDGGQRLANAVRMLTEIESAEPGVAAAGLTNVLPAFHVELNTAERPATPRAVNGEPPSRYLALTTSADAEAVALGGKVLVMLERSSLVSGAGVKWDDLPRSEVEWIDNPSRLGFAMIDRAGPAQGPVAPGVVPLSFMPTARSAIVGRLDPIPLESLESASEGHPEARSRVSQDNDSR